MPRVPVAAGNLVEQRPTTDAKFRAADNGGGVLGGLGEGLQRLGQAGAQYAEVQQHIANQQVEAQAKTTDNALVVKLGAMRSTFQAQTGLNAVNARSQYDKDLDGLARETLNSVQSPGLRAFIKPIVDNRVAALRVELDAHANQQAFAANDEASVARIGLAKEEAVATNDPVSRQAAIATGLGEYAARAAAKGLPAEWVQSEGFRFESGVHRGVIEQMLDTDRVDEAAAYRDAHKDRINGADEAAIAAGLRVPLQRRETNADADSVMGRATAGEVPAPFSYADPLHGQGRAPVPGGQFNAHRDYGGHQGIDIPARQGTPVFASAPGVARISHSPLGGNIVAIEHGDGRVTRYMHLGAVAVKDGDQVGPDTQIGGVGMTGRTSGPHLHYEVRENGKPVDPDHAIATVQQSPQRHDLNRLLADADRAAAAQGWSPERLDRVKGEIGQRVSRDDGLLSRQQDDAKDAAYAVVDRLGEKFTSIEQIPVGLRNSISPEVKHSLIGAAEQNAKPKTIAGNGDAALAMELMAIRDPASFQSTDLRTVRHLMTPSEFAGLAKDQAQLRAAPPEAKKTANIRSEIHSAITFYGKDADIADIAKRDNPDTQRQYMAIAGSMRSYLDRVTDNGKRAPSDDEYRQAFNSATMKVVERGSGWLGGDVDKRIYDVKPGGRVGIPIPTDVRSRIVASFKRAGTAAPSEDQIARTFISNRGRPGFWE